MINDIVEWVESKGIPKLINQDIELYTIEKSLDLHPSTLRLLKLEANSRLRSRKKS